MMQVRRFHFSSLFLTYPPLSSPLLVFSLVLSRNRPFSSFSSNHPSLAPSHSLISSLCPSCTVYHKLFTLMLSFLSSSRVGSMTLSSGRNAHVQESLELLPFFPAHTVPALVSFFLSLASPIGSCPP